MGGVQRIATVVPRDGRGEAEVGTVPPACLLRCSFESGGFRTFLPRNRRRESEAPTVFEEDHRVGMLILTVTLGARAWR